MMYLHWVKKLYWVIGVRQEVLSLQTRGAQRCWITSSGLSLHPCRQKGSSCRWSLFLITTNPGIHAISLASRGMPHSEQLMCLMFLRLGMKRSIQKALPSTQCSCGYRLLRPHGWNGQDTCFVGLIKPINCVTRVDIIWNCFNLVGIFQIYFPGSVWFEVSASWCSP